MKHIKKTLIISNIILIIILSLCIFNLYKTFKNKKKYSQNKPPKKPTLYKKSGRDINYYSSIYKKKVFGTDLKIGPFIKLPPDSIAKKEFQDKKLVLKLLEREIIKNVKDNPGYIVFNNIIKTETHLKEHLRKAGIKKTELILAIWRKIHGGDPIFSQKIYANATFRFPDNSWIAVIIDPDNKENRRYRKGDEIKIKCKDKGITEEKIFTIFEISRQKVIVINRKNKKFELPWGTPLKKSTSISMFHKRPSSYNKSSKPSIVTSKNSSNARIFTSRKLSQREVKTALTAIETGMKIFNIDPKKIPRNIKEEEVFEIINKLLKNAELKPYKVNNRLKGILVKNIAPGGILKNAGIKNDDIITNINGQKIDDYKNLWGIYQNIQSKSNFKIEVERDGHVQTITYNIK
jgi:type II secretory pathway component PulC